MIKNKKNNKIIVNKKKIKLFFIFGGFDKKKLQSKMIKILLNNINYELIISEKFKPF